MNITTDEAIVLHKLFNSIEEQIKNECVHLSAEEDRDNLILGGVNYDDSIITIVLVRLNGINSPTLANKFQDYLNEKF